MDVEQENIKNISDAVVKRFEKDLSDRKTAEDQMCLISYLSDIKTYALSEFEAIWHKAGVFPELKNDDKFFSSYFSDASGKTVDDDFYDKVIAKIIEMTLIKLKPKMLPETIELGQRIFPEHKKVWS